MICDRLEKLAPCHLENFAQLRYDGGGMSVALAQFFPDDQARLKAVYLAVKTMRAAAQLCLAEERPTLHPESLVASFGQLEIAVPALHQLGRGRTVAPELQSILHDIRGGSLIALIAAVQLLDADRISEEDITRIYFYSRDHLKIMRNAIPEIDPEASSADRQLRPHSIELFRDKWTRARIAVNGASHRVNFECSYHGAIATRCLEFSGLDRVTYNFMNNAAHFSQGEVIDFTLFVPDGPGGSNLRFVIENSISPAQAAALAELTQNEPGRLFHGTLTTGGHGLGLSICAEFVRRAFGLKTAHDAVALGYLGVTVDEAKFTAWFHWPLVTT